jgi:hypothetical protein
MKSEIKAQHPFYIAPVHTSLQQQSVSLLRTTVHGTRRKIFLLLFQGAPIAGM